MIAVICGVPEVDIVFITVNEISDDDEWVNELTREGDDDAETVIEFRDDSVWNVEIVGKVVVETNTLAEVHKDGPVESVGSNEAVWVDEIAAVIEVWIDSVGKIVTVGAIVIIAVTDESILSVAFNEWTEETECVEEVREVNDAPIESVCIDVLVPDIVAVVTADEEKVSVSENIDERLALLVDEGRFVYVVRLESEGPNEIELTAVCDTVKRAESVGMIEPVKKAERVVVASSVGGDVGEEGTL